jgi:hypothetical protein
MSGLFASASGSKRNMPMVRMGSIAMLPEDKVRTEDLGDIDAYLIEAHSLGGISGSPVFVTSTRTVQSKAMIEGVARAGYDFVQAEGFSLLGLVHGHWKGDSQDINAVYVRPSREAPAINLGISLVIPAQKILETLNQETLIEARNSGDEVYPTASGHPNTRCYGFSSFRRSSAAQTRSVNPAAIAGVTFRFPSFKAAGRS